MPRKTVALSLDEKIYDNFKKFCEKRGIILSRQVDNFMKDELKKVGVND